MTKFHLFSRDSVRLDEDQEFNSVIYWRSPAQLKTAPTGPGGNIELPKYLFKLHETTPTGEVRKSYINSKEEKLIEQTQHSIHHVRRPRFARYQQLRESD